MLTPGDRNVNRVAPSELRERSLSRGKAGAHRPEREAAGSADITAERREGEQRHPEPILPGLKCLPPTSQTLQCKIEAHCSALENPQRLPVQAGNELLGMRE